MTTITNLNKALTKANELHKAGRTYANGVVSRNDAVLNEWAELISSIAEAMGIDTNKVIKMATDFEVYGDAYYSETHHAVPLAW